MGEHLKHRPQQTQRNRKGISERKAIGREKEWVLDIRGVRRRVRKVNYQNGKPPTGQRQWRCQVVPMPFEVCGYRFKVRPVSTVL